VVLGKSGGSQLRGSMKIATHKLGIPIMHKNQQNTLLYWTCGLTKVYFGLGEVLGQFNGTKRGTIKNATNNIW